MYIDSPVIVLTGATGGIGKATATALAPQAGKLILVARNRQKLDDLVAELSSSVNVDHFDTVVADLSEPASVEAASKEILATYQHIDILINNAGGFFSERKENSVGQELTFALNHLGYFHLTTRLLPLLKASSNARIINVASAAHVIGKINVEDLMFTSSYSGMKAYAQSKLANILFSKELARRLRDDRITVNCLHPGTVNTNIMDNLPVWLTPLMVLGKLFMLTPEQGAQTTVYLATSEEVETVTGEYFVKKRPKDTLAISDDPALADQLWEISERLIEEGLQQSKG